MVLKIKTNITPDIEINTDAQGVMGVGRVLGSVIQPSIEVFGFKYAPYGEPRFKNLGLYAVIILALIIILWGIK